MNQYYSCLAFYWPDIYVAMIRSFSLEIIFAEIEFLLENVICENQAKLGDSNIFYFPEDALKGSFLSVR